MIWHIHCFLESMVTVKKMGFILPLLLTFCGDGQEQKSANWLTTDASSVEGLNVPATLHAACQSDGHIKISWDEFVTTATDFVIERKSPTEDFEKVGEVSSEDLFFIDEVANGIIYTYRIRGVIMQGNEINYVSESYSVEASASAASMCPVIVDTPIDFEEVPIGFEPV